MMTGKIKETSMYCRNCGAEIPENAAVCPKCGMPVSEGTNADGSASGNAGAQNTQQNQSWQNTQQNQNWQNRTYANNYQSNGQYVSGQTLNGYAVASLVLGIVGFFLSLFGTLPILAIVFGAVAKRQISDNPAEYRGDGYAMAGIILGIIALVLTIVLIILGASMISLLG